MSTNNLNSDFYLQLLEFLFGAKHRIMALGNSFGLTSIQAITLILIDVETPRPMKSLCNLYNCDASNMTGIIDGLEGKGLVSRQSDPSDRRLKIVQLEPAGRKLQAELMAALQADDSFLFDTLTSEESQQLAHIISKLAARTVTASNS